MRSQPKLLVVRPRVAVAGFALLYGAILAGCLMLLFAGGIVAVVAAIFGLLAAVGLANALLRPELWKGGTPQRLGTVIGLRGDGTRVVRIVDTYSTGLLGPLAGMATIAILGCCCGGPIAFCLGLV